MAGPVGYRDLVADEGTEEAVQRNIISLTRYIEQGTGEGVGQGIGIQGQRVFADEGGGLLSEQPLGTEPSGPTLVARDRLQSGSSQTTVIIQSGVPSGTLHTARFTLEQGRQLAIQAPAEDESGDPAWEANRRLIDPEGCDPKILRPNSDRLRKQIAERRPVADLIFADPSQLVEGLKGRQL